MRNWVEDFDPTENDIYLLTSGPIAPPGLSPTEELGGAYMTVSQQGSEREHRQHVVQATTTGAVAPASAPASP
jgi:hypothetical protein